MEVVEILAGGQVSPESLSEGQDFQRTSSMTHGIQFLYCGMTFTTHQCYSFKMFQELTK